MKNKSRFLHIDNITFPSNFLNKIKKPFTGSVNILTQSGLKTPFAGYKPDSVLMAIYLALPSPTESSVGVRLSLPKTLKALTEDSAQPNLHREGFTRTFCSRRSPASSLGAPPKDWPCWGTLKHLAAFHLSFRAAERP